MAHLPSTVTKVKCDLYEVWSISLLFLSPNDTEKARYNSEKKRAMKPDCRNAFMETMLEAIVVKAFPAFAYA